MCQWCNREKQTIDSVESIPIFLERITKYPDKIEQAMRDATKDVEYDTLVGSGMSGAMVIPTLAGLLGKKWAIVRESTSRHAEGEIIGEIGHKWLFVDDFIGTGKTLNRVIRGVEFFSHIKDFPTQHVGNYTYQPEGRAADNTYFKGEFHNPLNQPVLSEWGDLTMYRSIFSA